MLFSILSINKGNTLEGYWVNDNPYFFYGYSLADLGDQASLNQ